MVQKSIIIDYLQYDSANELSPWQKKLYDSAVEATSGSYAPYSKFHVGAAVLMSNGEVVTGANQENSAYPSGLCAERVASFAAKAKFPDENIQAIAIAAVEDGNVTDSPAYPCGACRQVLSDYESTSGQEIKVILGGKNKVLVFDNIRSLMPFVFDNLFDRNKKG